MKKMKDVFVPKKHKNFLRGGEGDKLRPQDVDQDELKRGIADEMEHTDDPAAAEDIALDHLAEDPYYYSKGKNK